MVKKVVVFGGTGMLGAMVTQVLAGAPDLRVTATRRQDGADVAPRGPVGWLAFDAFACSLDDCRQALGDADWAINCIGITKPLIADDDAVKVERAIRVNSLFPHALAAAAQDRGTRILQIATDCVFSGLQGDYCETSPHDALDVYGKTKSLGEVSSPLVHHLRSSIIGPEPKEHKFLLDWFTRQARAASLNGFTNHDWNGVTTLHFARVALGIVRAEPRLPHLHHLVPTGRITKAAMLESFARAYDRPDITINRVAAGTMVNRTLTTNDARLNGTLWEAAGYAVPPTVDQMIHELADFSVDFVRSAAA